MKPQLLLTLVAISLIFTSCEKGRVLYKENQSFGEDYYWYKNAPKTFTIDVTENKHPYQFVLTFRYASSYFYDKVFMKITETDPSGDRVTRDVEVRIRDEKGDFIGDKGYDIIDLEYVLDEKKNFPVFGKYTYEINQDMDNVDPLQFCMEIGLIVRDMEEVK